jgi:O-antigen/teichoic acid export membrane protein
MSIHAQFKSILNSQGLRQSGLTVGANTFATGISAITLIILSRVLGPEQFGLFSVAFSLTLFLARFGDFGLNMAVQKYVSQLHERESERASGIIVAVAKLKALIGMLLFIVGIVFGKLISAKLFGIDEPLLIQISIAFSGVIIAYDFGLVLLQSALEFAKAALLPFLQSILKLTTVGILMIKKIESVSFIYLIYTLAPLISVIASWKFLPSWFSLHAKLDVKDKQLVIHMTKFTAIAVVSAAVVDHVDTLMVKMYLNEFETGLFAAASRISLLIAVMGYSLGAVLNARVARYAHQDHLAVYLKKAMLISIVALMGIGLSLPFNGMLLSLTAGSAYVEALSSLHWLVASSFVVLATVPFVAIFYAVEFPLYFALSGVAQTISLIGLNALLIPRFGIEGAGYARFFSRILILVLTLVILVLLRRRKDNAFNTGEASL